MENNKLNEGDGNGLDHAADLLTAWPPTKLLHY